MLKRPLAALLSLALVASVVGCEDVSVTQSRVAALEVNPASASVLPNQTVQFSATALDASGTPLSGRAAEWTALDPEVATVSSAGLVRGVAPGSARIRATIEGQTATVSVHVGSSPQIALSQPAVQFSATVGGSTTQPVTVAVTNGGGGSLAGLGTSIAWGSGPTGWLQATLSGSTAPTTLSLRATPGSLPPGRYEAVVTVTPSGSGASPGTLTVVFQVAAPGPSIGVSPGAVGFASSEGQGAPPFQTVRITNAGGGAVTGLSRSISYVAGSGSGNAAGWLTATLAGSSAPTDLVLAVNPQGLTPGVYDAEVRIAGSGGAQAAVVQIRYRYGEAPPQFEVTPGSVTRSAEQGASALAPDTFRITNAGTGTLDGMALSVDYTGSARGWVSARLTASRAPAQLIVTLDPGTLAPGTYEARARLTSSAAVNSPTTVLLRLQVEPRIIRASASRSTLGASPATVNTGQASNLLVQLRDADGNTMTTGGDGVFLTTTHGTLSRTTGASDDNGRFTATLSASTAGAAVVTAHLGSSASDPLIGTTTVTVQAPAGTVADAGRSTLGASTSETTAGGSAPIVVQLRDAAGNALTTGGDQVFLSTSLGSLSRTSGTTDSSGRFSSTLTSSAAGTAVVSAYLGTTASDPRIGTTSVTFLPSGGGGADAGRSTLEVNPTRFTTDDDADVEIQLRDANGNDFEREENIFLVTTIGVLERTSGRTDDDGEFETRLSSGTVGTGTVTAYLGTDASGPRIGSVNVRVDPGKASVGGSTIEASPTSIDVKETSTIVVQLRDAAGNPVRESGEDIYLRASGGKLSRTTGETDRDGRFVVSLTVNPSNVGTITITAWLDDDGDDDDDRIGSVQVRVTR